jgi:hypothetical protein
MVSVKKRLGVQQVEVEALDGARHLQQYGELFARTG